MAATQYVDIVGSGFVQGVSGTFANCRVYYDGTQILHVGPLYVDWPAPPPPVRAGVSVEATAFGAAGNGTTNDTAAIQAAINAVAASAGAMGEVHLSAGIYISTGNTLASNVSLRGDGVGATILKLNNGSNADLLSAYTSNISLPAASVGSGSSTGVSRWAIRDMTLDGNKANQTGGPSWCVRVYGYTYLLQNVVIRNGYSGGMLTDWNGPDSAIVSTASPDHAATFINCEFHDNAGIGFQAGGPADSRMLACNSYLNDSHGVHLAPNASAFQLTNCHNWGPKTGVNAVPWLIEAGYVRMLSCFGEDSDGSGLVLLSNENYINGHFFSNAYGVQLGQNAGGTPYPGSLNQAGGVRTAVNAAGNRLDIDTSVNSTAGINFVNESNNFIDARTYQTAGNYAVGTPSSLDNYRIIGSGLTADGTLGKSGGMQFANGAFSGLLFYDANGNQVFNFNAPSAILGIGNSGSIRGYSDAFFSTQQWSIESAHGNVATNGQVAFGQSASAPDPGANGTVTTANVSEARVNPSGASRTGCILQAGTVAGQHVCVVNENASNTISWATEATSNIATETGGTFVLSGKRMQHFVWDSSLSRWIKSS